MRCKRRAEMQYENAELKCDMKTRDENVTSDPSGNAGKQKIAWGITGAGDRLEETVSVMRALKSSGRDIDVFVSKEGVTVLKWYGFYDDLCAGFRVREEAGPNEPFIIGPLRRGEYEALVVCPATANTVAKIVCGIADTLLTNAVAQTAKSETPVFILPVDAEQGTIHTKAPDGREFTLTIRRIDAENAAKLKEMENITVVRDPEDFLKIFRSPASHFQDVFFLFPGSGCLFPYPGSVFPFVRMFFPFCPGQDVFFPLSDRFFFCPVIRFHFSPG